MTVAIAAVEEQHQYQHDHDEYRGEGSGEAEVQQSRHLFADQGADHLRLRTTNQRRGDEEAQRHHEDQHATRRDARQAEREGHLAERRGAGGAEAPRSGHQGGIDSSEGSINGQDHEREHHLGHRHDHRALGIEQRQRLGDDPQPTQRRVDDAVSLQQHDPRIAADQDAGPQWNQDSGEQQSDHPSPCARHHVGERIGEHEGQRHDDGGDPDGSPHDAHIDRLTEESLVLGEAEPFVAAEALGEQHDDRDDDDAEQQSPEGQHQQHCGSRPVPRGHGTSTGYTRACCGSQPTVTSSSAPQVASCAGTRATISIPSPRAIVARTVSPE